MDDKPTLPTKDKLSASLLALFFGSFGIHKFYLGQTTAGIVYLAVSALSGFILSPIISLLSLIDGIRYLIQSDEQFNEINNTENKFVVSPTKLNKHIAALLAMSLGILGMHKFYVGKVKQGVIYLVCGIVIPFVVFLPLLIISFIIIAISADSSDVAAAIGFILYFVSYLGLVGFLFITQLVSMIEGAIILFNSEEKFDQNNKV